MHKHKIVKDWGGIDRLIHYCKITGYCSFDFETTSVKYYDPLELPTTIAISFQPGSAYVIPLSHFESPFKDKDEWIKVLQYISRALFEDPQVIKVGQNIKFEAKWLLRYDCHLKGRVFDTMLAKHLLDEERPHGLDHFVNTFIPNYSDYWLEINGLVKKYGWSKIPLKPLAKYNALDADMTLRLMLRFERKLIDGGFYRLFRNLLMPLSAMIARGEYHGIQVDRAYLENLLKTYEGKISKEKTSLYKNKILKRYEKSKREEVIQGMIKEVKREIKALRKQNKPHLIKAREDKISRYIAGQFTTNKEKDKVSQFNFASPKQLVDILYTHDQGFNFPIIEYTKDKNKRDTTTPSTAEAVLEKLKRRDKSGFINSLLEFRALEKLYSTYIAGMFNILDADNKVHANFKIHGTVTGRMSCTEPNLQNIPRGTTAKDIKQMFVAPPGYAWVEVDYSQAELRVVAEMAKDKAMIDIFRKNYNIHVATACKINNCLDKYEEVKKILADPNHKDNIFWEKQKKVGKVLNFSILYMQGDQQTAEQMGVPVEEAKRFKKEWFRSFPQVTKFLKKQFEIAYKYGYVKTMFGMKRRLPNIYSPVKGLQFAAHRQAVNAPIQGTASQFTLFSMVIADEMIRKGELPEATWIYNVHDSIGYLVKVKDVHKFVQKIVKVCSNPRTLEFFGFEMKHVSMKVSPEVGSSWGNLLDYDPWVDYGKTIINK